jgi:hypothetical protein
MTEKHIEFSELDFEKTESLPHADHCEEYAGRLSVFRFLGFQVNNAPEMEIPPFFPKRVSQLAQSTEFSFAFACQQAAGQLIPVFMALLLGTSLLLYFVTDPESAAEQYSELFFDQPLQEDLSMDYVVDFLGELPRRKPSLDRSR